MHILFLDESGTPPSSDNGNNNYFVIAGVTVPAHEWKNLERKLAGLKSRYRILGEFRWRYFSPANTDAQNPFRNHPRETVDQVRLELYEIINSIKSIKVLAAVTSIRAAFGIPSIDSADGLYYLTYKPLTERFQYYLQDLTREVGSPQFGIVVIDHRANTQDRALRRAHQNLLEGRSPLMSKLDNLIETVFFTPSHLSVGIQLADMVAGPARRHPTVRSTRRPRACSVASPVTSGRRSYINAFCAPE